MTRIVLNGAEAEAPAGESIQEMIRRLGLDGPIAVMVNDEIVSKDKLGLVRLQPGDRVELLRMMGGG